MAVQEKSAMLLPKYAPIVHDLATTESIALDEMVAMYYLAYPVVCTYVLELTPGLISLLLVGQMTAPDTKRFVVTAALSVMYLNVTALAGPIGIATAMDTLDSTSKLD
ncbi:unnamed protein product [Aphanomyces euteiches]